MTKTASLYLKGIAILMMLATHLLFFVQSPNILSIPLPNGSNVSAYIGYACALCVPVFAFINGYGLSKVYEGKSLGQIYLYSIKKMGLFLLEYWIILFSLFVPFYACSVAGAVDWLLILRSLFVWGGGFSIPSPGTSTSISGYCFFYRYCVTSSQSKPSWGLRSGICLC